MSDKPWHGAPLRATALLARDHIVRECEDGTIYISHRRRLGPYPERLTDCIAHWARTTPDALALADRKTGGGWRKLTYAELHDAARRLGQALLDLGLSTERPLAILTGNDLEHAMLSIAAMHVGIAYAPISPAYATMGEGHPRLRETLEAITPGLVYAADPAIIGFYEGYIRFLDPVGRVIPARDFVGISETREIGREIDEQLYAPVAAAIRFAEAMRRRAKGRGA